MIFHCCLSELLLCATLCHWRGFVYFCGHLCSKYSIYCGGKSGTCHATQYRVRFVTGQSIHFIYDPVIAIFFSLLLFSAWHSYFSFPAYWAIDGFSFSLSISFPLVHVGFTTRLIIQLWLKWVHILLHLTRSRICNWTLCSIWKKCRRKLAQFVVFQKKGILEEAPATLDGRTKNHKIWKTNVGHKFMQSWINFDSQSKRLRFVLLRVVATPQIVFCSLHIRIKWY